MRVLLVHPSCLMYAEIYLRLEPLGLELVAAAARQAGHAVRLLDLQTARHADYFRLLDDWRPEAVGFSLNYLANIPEVIDLAIETRHRLPQCFIFAGGHSVSFTAEEMLEHGEGAIDCVLKGEGEASVATLLDAIADGDFRHVPGAVTRHGQVSVTLEAGPQATLAFLYDIPRDAAAKSLRLPDGQILLLPQ